MIPVKIEASRAATGIDDVLQMMIVRSINLPPVRGSFIPNAPTGLLLSLAQVRELLERNPESVVVVDEAYCREHPAAHPGPCVRIRVNDSGVGMSEEVREQIFEPFFTTKEKHGTGLGLSITYGIVEKLGGKIVVDSQEGEWTKFTVILPVDPEQGAQNGGNASTAG